MAHDAKSPLELLRAYLVEERGVLVGGMGGTSKRLEKLEREHGTCGTSVREWAVLIDELLADDGWQYVFRDAVSLKPVPGTKQFSLMIQGEGDYHWTIALADLGKADPPVTGYRQNERSRWVADSGRRGPYGKFPTVTDFLCTMVELTAADIMPHPRLHGPPTPRPAPSAPPCVTELQLVKGGTRPTVALDEVMRMIASAPPDERTGIELLAVRPKEKLVGLSIGLYPNNEAIVVHVTYKSSQGTTMLASLSARSRPGPGGIYISRDQAAAAVRFFARDGELDPSLTWA